MPLKLTVSGLLSAGYFPPELPPPFSTESFAAAVTNTRRSSLPRDFTKKQSDWYELTSFSLSRPGSLRRRLAIVNPVPYFRLASFIVSQQRILLRKIATSRLSLFKLEPDHRGSLRRSDSFDAIPLKRAEVRVGKHFSLTADVSRFYPSIYTHVIDWAVRSKVAAKRGLKRRRTRKVSIGSQLDKLVQACQNRQTRGIPIGPAVSLLLGELILTRVDEMLARRRISNGFRAVDDYELAFRDRAAAERALTLLEDALAEFELELNPHKTSIAELPQKFENPGIQELRGFQIRAHRLGQRSDLFHLFTRAFDLQRQFPDSHILRYAAALLRKTDIDAKNASLLQDLILQAVAYEAGVWPIAIYQLRSLHQRHPSLSTVEINETVHSLIKKCARLGHSSEVAWSLWAALVFNLKLSRDVVNSVVRMFDDCSCILLFHAEQLGLTQTKPNQQGLRKYLSTKGLRGPHWLMAYELGKKRWVDVTRDYIAEDPVFAFLRANNVEFYDMSVLKQFPVSEEEEAIGYPG
jgi:hypothetical protein